MFGRNKKDEQPTEEKRPGFFKRMRQRLNRGDSWLTYDLANLVPGDKISDELIEELETRLLLADVGVDATEEIMRELNKQFRRKELARAETVVETLRGSMLDLLKPVDLPLEIPAEIRPFVLLVVGVNGSGKTTTIGKLAKRFQNAGLSVMLAAGDTFRAAAVEQLKVWGERNDVPVVSQAPGADPAAVVFDAFEAARARGIDVLIADTAGRLHTQDNLMEELKKVKRVLGRLDETAPHETLLVLDGSLGQNALKQAQQFHAAIDVTGLALTKLDGTAKGGILLAIAQQEKLPIRFIGIGEAIDDLGPFNAAEYVDALLSSPGAPGAPEANIA